MYQKNTLTNLFEVLNNLEDIKIKPRSGIIVERGGCMLEAVI